MQELAKKSEIKPVSFDRSLRGVTHRQTLILKLLSDRLKEGSPVTKADIRDIYARSHSEDGFAFVRQYCNIDGVWGYHKVRVDLRTHWRGETNAMQWFKTNLGSCIIKGKLLAIPVIES